MSELTLDEAIKHCLEVASENDSQAAGYNEHDEWEFVNKCNCEQCAAEHRQLAEWLMELKELRILKTEYEASIEAQKLREQWHDNVKTIQESNLLKTTYTSLDGRRKRLSSSEKAWVDKHEFRNSDTQMKP